MRVKSPCATRLKAMAAELWEMCPMSDARTCPLKASADLCVAIFGLTLARR
jgi:hypothetical protein